MSQSANSQHSHPLPWKLHVPAKQRGWELWVPSPRMGGFCPTTLRFPGRECPWGSDSWQSPWGMFFGGMVHCLFQGSHGVYSWGFQCPPLWDFSVPVFDEWLFAWLPRAAEEECNFRHSFPCCLSNNSLSPSWKAHYSWAHLSQVQEHRDVFMEHCLFKGNSSKLLIQNIHLSNRSLKTGEKQENIKEKDTCWTFILSIH